MKHLYLFLLFFCNFLVSGFEQSTIVWSESGHAQISSIAKNDHVIACDNGSFCSDRVAIAPITVLVDSYFVIHFENEVQPVVCSRFQQFLTTDDQWIKAIDLKSGDCLQGTEPVYVASTQLINKPIVLYDLCVVPHHTFCVGNKKIVVHNFIPFIGLTLSVAFGTGVAEWSLGILAGIAAFGSLFGFAMNKNHKKEKMTVKPVIKPNQSTSGNDPDKNNDDNERKYNIISKTVFFKKVKDKYRFDKQTGIYKKIKGQKGLRCSRTNKEIEYLRWDGQHGDVEAFADKNTHLGSIRPSDYVMYRDPEPGRKV